MKRNINMNMKTKKWDDFRDPYQGIIRNLINNIDICNERYAKDNGDEGYMVARGKYIKELEDLKTWIKKKEIELDYYKDEQVNPDSTVLFDLHKITKNKKSDDSDYGQE